MMVMQQAQENNDANAMQATQMILKVCIIVLLVTS